jgi:hypothetical protein
MSKSLTNKVREGISSFVMFLFSTRSGYTVLKSVEKRVKVQVPPASPDRPTQETEVMPYLEALFVEDNNEKL